MMTNQTMPYISHNPGDLLSAGDWNQMQLDIKSDILANKQAAKDEIREEGVNMAGNSEKFDNQTSTEWVAQLDERYAHKVHDHEETAGYRRYIKRFTEEDEIALLEHGLGRYPLVDIYELKALIGLTNDRKILEECPDMGLESCKLFVYYGHREAERYGMMGNIHRQKIKIGVPLEVFLTELSVSYEDDDTLGDVLNDMLDAFMEDPNDEISHCRSDWIEQSVKERRKVLDLKQADEWPDIKVALLPVQLRRAEAATDMTVEYSDSPVEVEIIRRVNIAHANYETTVVFVEDTQIIVPDNSFTDEDKEQIRRRASNDMQPLDLMILLRS